jgi:hypothetical protein
MLTTLLFRAVTAVRPTSKAGARRGSSARMGRGPACGASCIGLAAPACAFFFVAILSVELACLPTKTGPHRPSNDLDQLAGSGNDL